ncbi:hypothetical protein ACQ4LE_006745 [Meloidogyne hapla]
MLKYFIFSFFIFFYLIISEIDQIEALLGGYEANCGCKPGFTCCYNMAMKEDVNEKKAQIRCCKDCNEKYSINNCPPITG